VEHFQKDNADCGTSMRTADPVITACVL